MKKLLAIAVLLGFVCPMLGFGEWKAERPNLYVVNRTKEKIRVWVIGGTASWNLDPGQGGWFVGPAVKSTAEMRRYPPQSLAYLIAYDRARRSQQPIKGPLSFFYRGNIYESRHFFTMPHNATWTMEIHPHNTRGAKYKGLPGVRLILSLVAQITLKLQSIFSYSTMPPMSIS